MGTLYGHRPLGRRVTSTAGEGIIIRRGLVDRPARWRRSHVRRVARTGAGARIRRATNSSSPSREWVAGVRWSTASAHRTGQQAETGAHPLHLHREVESIDVDRVGDVVGMDVADVHLGHSTSPD